MKALIIKSNHGNHRGFNRKWTIINECEESELHFKMSELCDQLADEYGLSEEQSEDLYSTSGFEYDTYYYVSVTEDDYNRGIFDGGHYGYASKEIKEFFENLG